MAKAKEIIVKETPQQLKQLLKQQSKESLRNRLIMLQQIKKSKVSLSKIELAEQVGVNPIAYKNGAGFMRAAV